MIKPLEGSNTRFLPSFMVGYRLEWLLEWKEFPMCSTFASVPKNARQTDRQRQTVKCQILTAEFSEFPSWLLTKPPRRLTTFHAFEEAEWWQTRERLRNMEWSSGKIKKANKLSVYLSIPKRLENLCLACSVVNHESKQNPTASPG